MKGLIKLILGAFFCCLIIEHIYAQSDQVNLKMQGLKQHDQFSTINTKIDSISKNIADANKVMQKADSVYREAEHLYSKSNAVFSINATVIYGFMTAVALIIAIAGVSLFTVIRNYRKKLAEITSTNLNTIRTLVAKHHKEQSLLNNARILIINKKGTNSDQGIEMVLNRFNNNVVEVKDLNTLSNHEITKIDFTQYSAVILDNVNYKDESLNWDFNNTDLKKQLVEIAKRTCSNNNVFLYFGDNRLDGGFRKDDELIQYMHLINFANQSATLFSNLINLLDLRSILNLK